MTGISLPEFILPFRVPRPVQTLRKPEIAGRKTRIGAIPEAVVCIFRVAARFVHRRVEEHTHAEIVLTERPDFALLQFDDQRPPVVGHSFDNPTSRSRPSVAYDGFDAVVLKFGNLQKLLQPQTAHIGGPHHRKVARNRAAFPV